MVLKLRSAAMRLTYLQLTNFTMVRPRVLRTSVFSLWGYRGGHNCLKRRKILLEYSTNTLLFVYGQNGPPGR